MRIKIIKKYIVSLVTITAILVGCSVIVKQDSGNMNSEETSIKKMKVP